MHACYCGYVGRRGTSQFFNLPNAAILTPLSPSSQKVEVILCFTPILYHFGLVFSLYLIVYILCV